MPTISSHMHTTPVFHNTCDGRGIVNAWVIIELHVAVSVLVEGVLCGLWEVGSGMPMCSLEKQFISPQCITEFAPTLAS